MRGSVLDDLSVIDLEVIDTSDPFARGSRVVNDRRTFEDHYATLAFGLGTVPRRQQAPDSFWQRPAGLLVGVGILLMFLTLLSGTH